MPAEKPSTKCSENRRSNKPIMEKRRRARINSCLNDLKALILEALKKDPARHSKLEKADILEMTVKHLQNLQRQQMALTAVTDPSVANKFRAGFNECAGEVTRYLNRMEGLDGSSRQRLLSHLTNCLNGLGAVQSFGLGGLAPSTTMAPPMAVQPLNIHVPMGVTGQMPLTPRASPTLTGNKMDASVTPTRLHLVPTRLPNGDFAFLLPANYALTTDTQTNNNVISSASLPSDMNTTNISQNALSPLTVNLPSRLAAPSDASPTKPPATVMPSMMSPPSQAYRGIVKMEPQMEELYHHEQFIKSAASPVSCRSFSYDSYSSPVRSEVFCKETLHKLEPWRPW